MPLEDRDRIHAVEAKSERRDAGQHRHERQRGAILRALVNDPLLILADEPTSSLDHETGLEVVDLLWRCAGGAALVICSHDPSMLERANRVLQLRDGVLSGNAPAKS